MRKILLTIIGMLTTLSSWAAVGEEPVLGARAGLDINSLTGPGYKNSAGWELGAVYNMPLIIPGVQGVYIEPGLYFYHDRWGVDKHTWADPDLAFVTKTNSVFFSTWGMRIPVVAGWRYSVDRDWSLTGFTGPVLSIGFTNDFHFNGKIDKAEAEMSWNAYDSGEVHRADLAWRIGIGADYRNWHFDISGDIGLTRVISEEVGGSHVNRVSLTAGYNFDL